MGKYYLSGVVIGFIALVVMAIIGGISNCSIKAQEQSRVDDMYHKTVTIRYYKDEVSQDHKNYTGEIGVVRIWKGDEISHITVPTKPGMIFAGLWNTPEFEDGVSEMYVDQDGNGVMKIWEDIVLYAHYVD